MTAPQKPDLPTLEARVREAREKVERHRGILRITMPYATLNQLDGLAAAYESVIAAAEALGAARERARCREAVFPLIGKFNSTYDHGVSDALDALETP